MHETFETPGYRIEWGKHNGVTVSGCDSAVECEGENADGGKCACQR